MNKLPTLLCGFLAATVMGMLILRGSEMPMASLSPAEAANLWFAQSGTLPWWGSTGPYALLLGDGDAALLRALSCLQILVTGIVLSLLLRRAGAPWQAIAISLATFWASPVIADMAWQVRGEPLALLIATGSLLWFVEKSHSKLPALGFGIAWAVADNLAYGGLALVFGKRWQMWLLTVLTRVLLGGWQLFPTQLPQFPSLAALWPLFLAGLWIIFYRRDWPPARIAPTHLGLMLLGLGLLAEGWAVAAFGGAWLLGLVIAQAWERQNQDTVAIYAATLLVLSGYLELTYHQEFPVAETLSWHRRLPPEARVLSQDPLLASPVSLAQARANLEEWRYEYLLLQEERLPASFADKVQQLYQPISELPLLGGMGLLYAPRPELLHPEQEAKSTSEGIFATLEPVTEQEHEEPHESLQKQEAPHKSASELRGVEPLDPRSTFRYTFEDRASLGPR